MRLLVTNIERESCDDRRFSFEPVGAPRSLTNTQGMQINCWLYFFRRAWNAYQSPIKRSW
ncbi:hypothetical protein HMPREF9540_00009 [Escherichia coli MS 115-1]|nr:hypothetical protein HMPREF9540_00009 [Escherichia coli MS 115-1]